MRRGARAAVCVVLCACSSFGAAADPATDAGRADASTDASTDGGVATDAAPTPSFCARASTTGRLFCSDFDEPKAFTAEWPDVSAYKQTLLLKPVFFGANRAAGVKGLGENALVDRLRSAALPIPSGVTSFDLELKIHLTQRLSKAEIVTIETPHSANDVILVLSDNQLRIRVGTADSEGLALEVGAWSTVVLHGGVSGMTLRGPASEVTMTLVPTAVGNGVNVALGVGVNYKEGAGALDFALDDILLTAR